MVLSVCKGVRQGCSPADSSSALRAKRVAWRPTQRPRHFRRRLLNLRNVNLEQPPSTSQPSHNRQNDKAYGSLPIPPGLLLIAIQAQRRSASRESTEPVTVLPCVSRSRRWRCAALEHPHSGGLSLTSPPDHTARPLRLPVLRKERRQAHCRRYLELPILPQDHRRRSLHSLVRHPALVAIALVNQESADKPPRTPAAAATRSTIRRLREIAEV
jgi:hypothetical protein